MVGRKASAPQAAAPSFLIFTAGPGHGGKWSFFDFLGQKMATLSGVGAGAAACGGRGFWPFGLPFFGLFGQIWGQKRGIYPSPSAPFLGPFLAVCPTIFGHFGPKIVGAQKSCVLGTFLPGALFWCWSWVSFLAFGQIVGIASTCRVLGQKSVGKFHFFGQNTTRRGCRRFFGLKKGQNYHRLGDFGSVLL